jgi:ATP-dependent Clp protease ATP-binding subunit ClpC
MFERYAQNARRVIFHAREEAMLYGSPYIESEHLLLGILRENESLANRIAGEMASVKSFRQEIEAKTTIGQTLTGPVEVPLSADSKRILTLAWEEAGSLGHRQVTQCVAEPSTGPSQMQWCASCHQFLLPWAWS